VSAGSIGAVSLAGQDNSVEGTAIGDVRIVGDRNALEVEEGLGAVSLTGNDNRVEADAIGLVTDEGQRNLVIGRVGD
jgi:hypothetical protein